MGKLEALDDDSENVVYKGVRCYLPVGDCPTLALMPQFVGKGYTVEEAHRNLLANVRLWLVEQEREVDHGP